MPRLLPPGEDPYSWNSDNYLSMDEPGKERGNPPGHKPDGGAGSGNFQFAAPVLSLDGRGLDLNLGLMYNSRVWHKANSEITFDIDRDWPAPGWSLGFGKIVGMGAQNGYMIIEPDGTRRPYICSITYHTTYQEAVCKTTDGSFIDYKVLGDTPANGGGPQTSSVFYPNGVEIVYVAATGDIKANYPSQIIDANGNRMLISYRNNLGPQIDKITDPLGRVIQFYYDSNNLPVAITGPGLDGSTRTLVRITYESKNLLSDLGGSYGFSGLTPKVRNNVIPVIKAIYYPANNTGYWLGEPDSYSDYGMLAKVIEQRGMAFSAAPLPEFPNQSADPGTITPGPMSRQIVYDYQMAASGLTIEPYYLNTYETWASMDVGSVRTQYFVQENASPRRVEITRPDNVKTVMLSHNAPGQWYDGLIYQDETYNPQGDLLGKSFVQWEQGECPPPGQAVGPYQYCAPRPSRVETTDERGQQTGKEFSYGPRFNQVIETREYGYGYVFGGANMLLRRIVNQYPNDPNYIDKIQGIYWRHHYNLVTVNEIYAGDGARLARTEYSYDQFNGAGGLLNTPGVVYTGHELAWNPYSGGYNPATEYRGNITTIKRYADAATLDEGSAVIETRHYDITGNVRLIENSCCLQTTFNYTLDTQYAWPESQISGSPSDINNQNTTSATYDFNTGLVMTSTDANGASSERPPSQTEYDPNTLRPVHEYSPTFAYNYHIYDDVAMTVIDYAYEAGLSGSNFASRSDKSLDGHGRVIKEVAFGKDNAQDIVDIKYDQLGRLWRQTRPYRAGATPVWNTVTYDFLDRPVQTIAPGASGVVTRSYNQPDPPGSSGQPGETIKVSDPWGRERWARSDALGRKVEVAEPDPGGNGTLSGGAMFTTYTYDALDRLVQVNQGVQTRSFRYDSLGRLTHQKLAEREPTLDGGGNWVGTGQWSDVFFYDTRSNLTRSVDARGVKTIFVYNDDPLNRLQAVQYDKSGSPSHLSVNIPVAPNVSYVYMTVGDKRRVQNVYVDQGMGNETMGYDSEGRLSQVVQTFTGRESYPLVTNYIWDSLDRLKENTYPMQYGAGEIRKKVEPSYDVASRLNSLKFGGVTYASEPVYNAASQTTSLKVGSQIFENYEYDPNTGLLTNQKVMRGTTETLLDLKYNYTLDNNANNNGSKTGQLTGITDLKNQARNRAYEYDKLGRLAKVKGGIDAFNNPNWYQTYSYDRYGNRSLVQHTDLGMAPVNPGSQAKSDLIGKLGLGAGGVADRIFSADKPFAAVGINKGYGSIAADFSGGDNTGTRMRGGPRVTEEEYGNAPSANGIGGESLAEHPAGAQPAAPQKEYGYRSGRSRSPVAAQSVVDVYPGAYQTPAHAYSSAVDSPSNTGHGGTYTSAYSSCCVGGPQSQDKSSRWFAFQPVSGQIARITLKFDWSTYGGVSTSAPEEGTGSASAQAFFKIDYSTDNGSNFTSAIYRGESSSVSGQGGESRPFSDSGSFSVNLPANTPINQIIVDDRIYSYAYAYGAGSESASASVNGTISNIKLEVEIDPTPPVISNVAAGGLTTTSATITWTTNENSDSQVEYGTTIAYGQSTALNSALVTSHSQALSVLTNGTLYHYRVKSRDAAGNLTVSGDFTFTTLDTIAPAISSVAAGGITTSSATITWTTNENADSQVEYGTTTSYGQSTALNPTLVTSHSQALSGLTAGTIYYYRVRSRDASGNLTISGDNTFTTVDNAAPVISGVVAGGVTATSATITWNTNEDADSQVEYGTTTAYGQSTALDSALVGAHSQSLSGLNTGTLYHYRVKSRDASGNLAVSGDFTFTTTDITAPVISNVAAGGISGTSATITWTTNENADSQVEYGTTTSYGQSTALDSTLVTSHSQALSALNTGTLYHYRVKSRDASGNLAVSGDFTFTTGDNIAPVISSVVAGDITATSATITWTTNENSDSQVEYGTTTAYGQSTALDSTLVTAHSQGLSGLAAGTLYHYRVKSRDGSGNLATSGDFSFTTTAAPPPPTTYSIWPLTTIPTVSMEDPGQPIELGLKFRSDVNGYITGVRFYKGGPENSGSHAGNLWTGSGTLLGSVTFTNETASGWQEALFPAPIPITANTTYVVSYFAPQGNYLGEDNFFFPSGVDNPPLHALRDGVDGANGVYLYTATSAFPTNTYQSENYWVDVVFTTAPPGPDTTPPTVASFSPIAGTNNVSVDANVTVAFSEAMNAASVNSSTIELRDPSNALVSATVSYNAALLTATLDPTASLAPGTTYTARVKGGAADPRVKDVAGNALAADLTWSFTTAAPPTCPCSIWGSGVTPTTPMEDPGLAVEIGLKFRSDNDGFITGVRFYKGGAANSGPHVGKLWTSSGTLLGSVTFTNETASGWQEALFPTPIQITANTTYVVSYFAPQGNYLGEDNFFATSGVDNGPLHALRDGVDGGNGVYIYGASGGFPTDTFASENYWVDVVFTTATPDTATPTVTSFAPVAGATNVSANANVITTFSEAMNAATVNGVTVELRDPSNALVSATVSYDAVTFAATLDPTAPLAAGTTYTARIKGGAADPRVKDVAGNALAADLTWTFTTAASQDTTPPAVTTFSPDSGAINVSPGANVTVTFSEAMDASSLNNSTIELRDPSNALVSATVSYNAASHTATLDPTAALAGGVTYTARVRGGAADPRVKDAAGNALAADVTWAFTTEQSVVIPLDGLANLSYNAANNRINTQFFEYDPAGNQTRAVINSSGTQQQYRYDSAGRLAQALDASGNVLATYSYGASNQRLMSVEGGVTKYFAWAGGTITAEYEAWGTNALIWKTSYVYLGGRLLATTSGAGGTETRFHHPDRLGTRLVTSVAGTVVTVVTEQLSMPFGTMLPFTQTYGGANSYQHPTLGNPSKKRFTSYDRSAVAELDYAKNRFYSSQQGRFTQVDPIGMEAASLSDPQTLNMYAYCGNDPINCIDPDGLFFGKLFGWIGKAFKFLFKVAAVALVVLAIVAFPGSAVAGLTLLGLAGASGLAGWHNGKLGTIAGRILSGGVGWKINARTPGTFPKGTGVGPVSDFVSAFQEDDPKKVIIRESVDIVAKKPALWRRIVGGVVRVGGFVLRKLNPVTSVIDLVMSSEVSTSSDDTIDTVEGYTTVYHKGELNRPSKPYLSTGTNKSSVAALNRPGVVHEFRIPKSIYYRWQYEGLIEFKRDMDFATGVINEEVRFLGKAKTEILKYKVP